MDYSTPAQLDLTLQALGDATRRAILRRLVAGEAHLTELAEPFAMSATAISKHLRMLERARLVRRRRDGRNQVITLTPQPLQAVGEWIGVTRDQWEKRMGALAELLATEAAAVQKSPRKR